MRFIHSADWQIGMSFRQFGPVAERVQNARLLALRRALTLAAELRVDGFLIAGDLFEDHQVDAVLVQQVFASFADFSSVPVFILPGNHDPVGSPGAIWAREPFARLPRHVKVFEKCEVVPLGDGWLIASPLEQKRSFADPTLSLRPIAAELPGSAVKVGMTHGSPAIGGLHQADDFPIALDAATKLGLDYLAIGHWHSPMLLDDGRVFMPGTPEPSSFLERGSGFVHEVEIPATHQIPRIVAHSCAELRWNAVEWDLGSGSSLPQHPLPDFSAAGHPTSRTLVRITLRGVVAPAQVSAAITRIEAEAASYLHCGVVDKTIPELEKSELESLQQEHSQVAGVLADLDELVAGKSPTVRLDLEKLSREIGCNPAELDSGCLEEARRLFIHTLAEEQAAC